MTKRRSLDGAMTVLFTAAGAVSIVFIFLIFIFIFKEARVTDVARFFTGTVWQPTSAEPKMSMIPLLLGTFKATFIALLFACPVGVAAALFSSEFAPRRMREFVKPVIELLAGIPSVVLGFFALLILAFGATRIDLAFLCGL